MPKIDKENGVRTYTTEDRQFAVKDQHLQRMYGVIDAINNVLQTASGDDKYADSRIDMLTMFFTTFVLNEKRCTELLDERDNKIDNIIDNTKETKKQNRLIFRENIKMMAKCMEEFDDFLGIKKKQVVMEVTNEDLKKKAMNFGMFEMTAAFAEDKTGTLLDSVKAALKEINEAEKRVSAKEANLKRAVMESKINEG